MKIKSKQQILQRRKEIEQKLVVILKKIKGDFGIDDIKTIIYNEKNHNDLMKIIEMFDVGQDVDELNKDLIIINDAWNYFPHKALGGLSPAEKMLKYEKEDKKIKQNIFVKHKKLTDKQKDLLWSGGGDGPYSQVNLIKQVRIIDDSVSRVFIVVEVEINPTTFEIIRANRNSDEFKNDVMIQQLLDGADYRGPQFGYVASAFENEYIGDDIIVRAEYALNYAQECIIKMHKYVMDNFKS